jgi:hypothetical protein
LPWPDGGLKQALERQDARIASALFDHVADYCGTINVRSPWGADESLTRRLFGEEANERWDGSPQLILKEVRVPQTDRNILVGGYLLSQSHVSTSWAGLTARVQNVAVEERTFFDVESDPGFRKYLTGEIFLFGDIDRSRLINIDRASFNRESDDYRGAQRFLSHEIVEFKAQQIQAPRRQKMLLRRRAEGLRDVLVGIREACEAADRWCDAAQTGPLPSSRVRLSRVSRDVTFANIFAEDSVKIRVGTTSGPDGIDVEMGSSTEDAVIAIGPWLDSPEISVSGRKYSLRVVRSPSPYPVVVRERPREIVVNLEHPALMRASRDSARLAVVLELAYLVTPAADADDLYERVLEISSHCA